MPKLTQTVKAKAKKARSKKLSNKSFVANMPKIYWMNGWVTDDYDLRLDLISLQSGPDLSALLPAFTDQPPLPHSLSQSEDHFHPKRREWAELASGMTATREKRQQTKKEPGLNRRKPLSEPNTDQPPLGFASNVNYQALEPEKGHTQSLGWRCVKFLESITIFLFWRIYIAGAL